MNTSSIYFILFPTLMVTVAHLFDQKQTSICMYVHISYTNILELPKGRNK